MNFNLDPVFGKCVDPDCSLRLCTIFIQDPAWDGDLRCLCRCPPQSHTLLGNLHNGVVQFFPQVTYTPKKYAWEIAQIDMGTSTCEDTIVDIETSFEEDDNGELVELTKTKFTYNTPNEKKKAANTGLATLCLTCDAKTHKRARIAASSSSAPSEF